MKVETGEKSMATWSKVKQQMEGFLAESLSGVVQYSSSSYRYTKEKPGQCYLKVRGIEVFAMAKAVETIQWYNSEQEIKKREGFYFFISEAEIEKLKAEKPMIPEERLKVILAESKKNECAKRMMEAQNKLLKSDFIAKTSEYLASSIDRSIESNDILLNVFALIDRRMGKSRLRKLRETISQKHSIVQYFYQLRCQVEGV